VSAFQIFFGPSPRRACAGEKQGTFIFLCIHSENGEHNFRKSVIRPAPQGFAGCFFSANVHDRGAVAANGGKMGTTRQEQTKQTAASRKIESKPRRKSAPKPGTGGVLLRNAVDKLVGQECSRIAKALVDRTIAGNMAGAKLLTELSGAKKQGSQPPPKKKKQRGLDLLSWLASEPQWEGAPEQDMETGDPAFYKPVKAA